MSVDWGWLSDDAVTAAPRLLGHHLVHGNLVARIVEVEAYRGADDPGSHGFRGPTPRNLAMFGPPGHAYVYFTYGNHWMLNVTCDADGTSGALLIRACRPIAGTETMRGRRPKARRDEDLLSGPGKICQAFAIGRQHNARSLVDGGDLRLEVGTPPCRVGRSTRIGIAVGKGDDLPWRFVDLDEAVWLSRPWRSD